MGIEKVFFDFDYCRKSEKLSEAEVRKRKEDLRAEVKHFIKYLRELNIKPLIVRTNRGFHIHVYLDSIYEINDELDFWKQVYKQLQIELLKGYDYRFNDPVVMGDLKRMCRIPLSIHEASGEVCAIVNELLQEDKIRSVEYFKISGKDTQNYPQITLLARFFLPKVYFFPRSY
jgi:DNA primase catalytic subunit